MNRLSMRDYDVVVLMVRKSPESAVYCRRCLNQNEVTWLQPLSLDTRL